jgi:hypothetical protein
MLVLVAGVSRLISEEKGGGTKPDTIKYTQQFPSCLLVGGDVSRSPDQKRIMYVMVVQTGVDKENVWRLLFSN